MKFSSDTYYQPFEAVWIKNIGGYKVFINQGSVHAFFKPETRIEVGDLIDILKKEDEAFTLTDGQFLFVTVEMTPEQYAGGFRIGVPESASIEVGDEVPETDTDSPGHMYYEICRAEDGKIKQKLCSDIWSGWRDEDDSASNPSESEISASSSSESDSSGSSSSSEPPEESSGSEESSY